MALYCTECGSLLQPKLAFGRTRQVCSRCSHVHFDDPKVAVGVVVEMDGMIVLGRRNHEPHLGRWSFPSGYVDAGETPEAAAVREVEEETGLDIRIDRLLGVYASAGDRTIFIAYAGSVTGGEMQAGEECFEVNAFEPAALPEMAFPHDAAIIEAWRLGRQEDSS